MTDDEVVERFQRNFTTPDVDEAIEALETMDEDFAVLAVSLNRLLPDGREKANVMTHLEQAWLWAGAAVVRA